LDWPSRSRGRRAHGNLHGGAADRAGRAVNEYGATGADTHVERRLNPAREAAVVPFIGGMMLAGLAGFGRS
jgi:hypothetical protein